MVDQTTVKDATTTTIPGAEALKATQPQPPTGPLEVEMLKAEIAELRGKYSKEVGDRDRGNARLATELKELRSRLEVAEKGTDSIARNIYGVQEQPTSEYEQWRTQHTYKQSESKAQETHLSHEQVLAIGEMRANARTYGVDYAKPPEELAEVIEEVTILFQTDPEKASEMWEKGLKKRDANLKTKAEAEAKTKKEEAEKKARQGMRDTATSTGGGQADWVSIRDAFNKNPTDPTIRTTYLEARRARGI